MYVLVLMTCTFVYAEQAAAKKQKDDEERVQEAIERQIERALASKKDVSHTVSHRTACL